MKRPWIFLITIVVAFAFQQGQPAARDIRQERVSFQPGASSATVSGSIKGYDVVDYLLGARAGQTMSVTITTSNLSSYFNVLPPASETALFVGSTSGNEWTGTLPVDGDYTVRVYLMRNAARRNETAKYTLTLGVTGQPADASRPGDAKVAGTPYHATGKVPCSVGTDPKGSAQCPFGVIRGAPGNAEVHLTSPAGQERVVTFAGATVSLADPAAHLTSTKEGDEWSIAIDQLEYYTVPEAVISGG